jgi:4-hydroxy-tetrahydrodipicolinate synthase
MSESLSGSIVALVTPMRTTGEVDWEALDRLLDWHVDSGTRGIVPMGTTGESATLDVEEPLEVVRRTVAKVAGRIPVIAGTGANSTSEALTLTRGSAEAGADAALMVTPYYNKPTQEGLYQHYRTVAEAVPIPIVLYNVPPRTACDMVADTVARLAEIDNIIGIKEACGDAGRVAEIRARCNDEFIILSGEDAQTLDMLKLGARGCISVTANVVPGAMATFCNAYLSGEVEQAQALDAMLQPLHEVLFVEVSPQPVKWVLAEMGRIGTGIRLPLLTLSEQHQAAVRRAFEEFGAL